MPAQGARAAALPSLLSPHSLTPRARVPAPAPLVSRQFQQLQESCDALLRRAGGGARSSSAAHSGHATWQWQEESAEQEAERREFERLRREWRREHDEDMKDTEASRERKWLYFKLVCAWVGLGGVFKLAAMQMAYEMREQEMRARANGERTDESRVGAASSAVSRWLEPVDTEDPSRRREQPAPLLTPR